MGYDAARGDMIEVQMRAFAGEVQAPKPWYQSPAVENYGPWAALAGGGLLLLLIALLVWRGRSRAKAAALAAAIAAGDAGAAAAAATSTLGSMLNAIGLGGLAEVVGLGPVDGAALVAEAQILQGGELKRPFPQALDYQEKLGAARDLVNGDRDRAMAVARQMLLADLRPAGDAVPAPGAAEGADSDDTQPATAA